MHSHLNSAYTKTILGAKTLASSLIVTDIAYVAEAANWAIQNVSKDLSKTIPKVSRFSTSVTISPHHTRAHLIHYSSLPTMFNASGFRPASHSKHSIATIFHLANARHRQRAQQANQYINQFHTASTTTAQQLAACQIPKKKISVIPLGINLKNIKQLPRPKKQQLKHSLGLPKNKIIIGSFQKDGVGWGSGLEPKLEKGPDILTQTLKNLNTSYPIHVLLTGPARGYVTQYLTKQNIPFTSLGYLPNHQQVLNLYHALDYYLISSRVEGGPLALLEAWASGVPIITTSVGMVPDIATHNKTASISQSTTVAALTEAATNLLDDPEKAQKITKNALQEIKKFNWPHIAQQYINQLYQPLL